MLAGGKRHFMGHMNVMWYVGKFDEATWQLFSVLRLSRACLSAEGSGMAAVEQQIEYKHELRAGDLVTVCSTVLEVEEESIRFRLCSLFASDLCLRMPCLKV